jgi:hypothetical protein
MLGKPRPVLAIATLTLLATAPAWSSVRPRTQALVDGDGGGVLPDGDYGAGGVPVAEDRAPCLAARQDPPP